MRKDEIAPKSFFIYQSRFSFSLSYARGLEPIPIKSMRRSVCGSEELVSTGKGKEVGSWRK